MKKINKLFSLPLIVLLAINSSCSNNKGSDYYDSKWAPGSDALVTEQPTLKNPIGVFTEINEIRRSQNRVALPSQGKANILVVPVSFKNDEEIQKEITSIDITIDDNDIQMIEDTYFNEKNKFGYPSVSSYYKTSSFGKLNLSGVVSPVVQLPKEYSDYLLQAMATSISTVQNEILDYIYNYLFIETETYYKGDFDSDDDGNIDAISIIGNYPYNLQFSSDQYTLYHQNFNGPNNVYFKDSINRNTPVNSFSFISSDFMKGYYSNHDSRMYISLIGLMIGLDDYRDLTGNTLTGVYRAPLSYLDPMSGSLGDHNSFSKYQLGWIEPRFIKAEDIPEEGLEITINSSIDGDSIILYTGSKSLFGEYLMIDLYTPEGINSFDSMNKSAYGLKLFNQSAVRVYQVDSRLVRSNHYTYSPFDGNLDFNSEITLPSGEKAHYIYDYAYTNSSVNKYSQYGFKNYPLVSLLSKKGMNRHLTDEQNLLTINDVFLQGDKFGSEDQIEGFYQDFSFHGNGFDDNKLNITFEIKSLTSRSATIVFMGAK